MFASHTAETRTPDAFTPDAFADDANPFFTEETGDHELMARWMLDQQEDEPEAN